MSEKNFDASLTSIAKRLKYKDYQQPNSLPLKRPTHKIVQPTQEDGVSIPSLESQKMRLRAMGGYAQQERMIYDKRKALDRALMYSYQGANVRKVDSKNTDRALINPNSVKQDYDDKIISIGYEYEYKPGTVFEWVNTGTKWLIYL